MPALKQQIVEFVQRPGYRAVKPKSLAKKLGVTKKRWLEFEAALTEAEQVGEIRFSDSGRVQAKTPPGTYVGIVHRISSGAAYIILHEPKPAKIQGDVFVDKHDLRDAQGGDEVMIKLLAKRRRSGQRCGFVVEVIERATNVFVGTYFEENASGWVQIDGTDFHEPIWVGDPGAKGAVEGDKVVVEMIRFPAPGQIGEAVLTKVLGARGTPGVDTQLIIHEYGIPDEMPEPILAEARIEAQNFDESFLEGRENLTKKTIVTIDPADARDFDDAISLEKINRGHWELGVHIADVSHFVQPGTALDREAELRGTSVYLPTKVIPMLPEVISNGLASLQEKRVRYTMSVFIEYTAEGIPVGTRFSRSAIKVTRRFAYEEVLPIIQSKSPGQHKHVPAKVRKLLCQMHELAMLLRKRRFNKGSLELDMPEIRLDLDVDGKVTGAHEHPHDESHQIIEEFMLAANIAVATELNDRQHNFLRRVHANPNESKVRALAEFAAILGYPIQNPRSRKDLQDLLHRVKGQPEERSLNYAFLRSLKQAEYSPIGMGHFALAEDHYCHFTSPIRRYPDLLVHRLMAAIVEQNDAYLGPGTDELIRFGRHCSTTERRAEKAERELTKIKLLSYLEERIGEQLEAVITGVDRIGLFCRGLELPAEGLVHISTMPGPDFYEFDRTAMALIGRRQGESYRLGDRVRVEVAHVDVDRRELNFKLIEKHSSAKRRPSAARKQSKRTKPGKHTKNSGKPRRKRKR